MKTLAIKKTRGLFLTQTVVTVIMALLVWLLRSPAEAISALLGGIGVMIPSLLFASILFRFHGAQNAKKIVNNFYLGEATKILVSVIYFALVFLVYRVQAAVFFTVYLIVAMSFWLSLLKK